MIDQSILDLMNSRSASVKVDYLSMGVYLMKMVGISKETAKSGNDYFKVVIDSGFKNEEGKTRYLFNNFSTIGTFTDKGVEKPTIDLLVQFFKTNFGVERFDQASINKCIGLQLSVATKRDENGYIAYWYSGNAKSLVRMEANYKPKDESNGNRPTPKAPVAEISSVGVVLDEHGEPIF